MGKKITRIFIYITAVFMILSCSNDLNYYDSIPRESVALIRIGTNSATSSQQSVKDIISIFLQNEATDDCGIDFTSPAYVFESPDGSIFLCGHLESLSDFENYLNGISEKTIKGKKDNHFALVNHSYLVGYTDGLFMIQGPVIAASVPQASRRMSRLMEMNPERSISSTDIFNEITNRKSEISLHARLSTFPKQFAMPFLIGTPTGTSPYDVTMDADVKESDGVIYMSGDVKSDNLLIQQSLQRFHDIFRPLSSSEKINDQQNASIVFYANVDGKSFVSMLESNRDVASAFKDSGIMSKISAIDGNMALLFSCEKSTNESVTYHTEVMQVEKSSSKDILYKVIINIDDNTRNIVTKMIPFLGMIKRIEYSKGYVSQI